MNRKSTLPRQVRIIAGEWKRTPLPVIEAHGLRPTPDRVRETVFNWLEHLQQRQWEKPVSYTHLTLPTKRIV